LVSKLSEGDRKIPFVALPGNPQSALVAFSSFGRPLLYSLLGRKQEELKAIELTTEVTTAKDFSRILPGNLHGNLFTPTGYLNSAMLRGVASAEGFALIEPGVNPVGSTARWIPL
jgi:molybdopterin molybdotransferase